ncbi:ROK family transcriptional regulator [Arthrobacter sp. SDTb3-6]|uniref:ROK family transcriptional regulator n=1 Tax=Arthrobacter sp. SDTb3-6 TaxID=2713571 RepID=UPI00159E7DF0|nr:ROK family protein [Arthrobacter sp. SDTb3-6]NVM99524.1 ROK family protein [Arthrobacter sp. SDTb3-6]
MLREDVATSPQLLRRMNVGAVLRYALAAQTFLASEVMAATGLTRSTVLGLCDTLVAQGWIDEVADSREAGQYSKGRPARRYRLRDRAGYIVAVDAGQHTVTAAVADLRGTILARTGHTIDGVQGPVRRTAARGAVDSVLAHADVRPEEVFLVVVGVPAPVDGQGHSPAGHDYWQHMNPGFPAVFDDCGRTMVDNDANLAALAEHARNPGLDSFATLLSGERFGAGLVVDGRLLRGRHGGAGEMRLLDIVQGAGSSEGLGFLAREWAVAASKARTLPPGSALAQLPRAQLSAEAVFAAAAGGDAAAQGIVDRLGERLARVAQILVSLLDVEKVIVAGAIAQAAQPVIDKAAAVLDDVFQPPVPELAASTLGADGVVLGALECGLSMLRDEPLSFAPFRPGVAR